MIYNVESTDQLALQLSMNKTELVEMQYKSMYDAGTFDHFSDFHLSLTLFDLRWTVNGYQSIQEHKRQQRCCSFNQ